VIRSGTVGRSVSSLVSDVRKVLEPNTATRLKERKSNKLRDFLAMAGPLGVSHLLAFNQTDAGINLRIARCPRGPTVTFRVNKFAGMRDVLKSERRPRAPGKEFGTPPLVSCLQKKEEMGGGGAGWEEWKKVRKWLNRVIGLGD